MQDGQFSEPTTNQSYYKEPLPQGKILPYVSGGIRYGNVGAYSPKPVGANQDLFDIDKIAYQSGFSDMLNSFIQGVNQTQISASQYGLFTNQKRIAEIEGGNAFKGELQKLESQRLAKQIDDISYIQQKNRLDAEISDLKLRNQDINNSILGDQQDMENAPVKKSYQIRERLLQGLGADASLGESLIYTTPQTAGSSFATMGATLLNAFGTQFAQKLATRAAASVISGPAAPIVASALALGTAFEVAYYARKLESEAEVGGAISEDYERLKAEYLQKTGKNELTQEENNDLIIQANQGADTQYWKNMSLSAIDAAQSMLLAGTFGKWFGKFATGSKVGRIGSKLAELYLTAKGEEVEEGVQFAYQKEKQFASTNNVTTPSGFMDTVVNKDFINGLREDYVDVLSSLDLGPIKGDGKYSDDKEFQFSVKSGFILGAIMGGASTTARISKDLIAYRDAANQLQKAGVENAEGNIFKFKSQIYKSFFEPSNGLFNSADSDDRVHYLREGIKALSRRKDANGEAILTPKEVQQELNNIDRAYNIYSKLNGQLENITSSWGKENKRRFNMSKNMFYHAMFSDSMQMLYTGDELEKATEAHSNALSAIQDPNFSLINLQSQIQTIDKRISTISQTEVGESIRNKKIEYLEKRKKDLQKQLNEELKLAKDLGTPVNNISQSTPDLDLANEDLLTAEMFRTDAQERYNRLLKVKNEKQLNAWFDNALLEGNYALNSDRLEQSRQVRQDLDVEELSLRENVPYDTLTEDQEKERSKKNRELLLREGYTEEAINSMTYEGRDQIANEILSTYARGDVYFNEDRVLDILSNLTSNEELEKALAAPKVTDLLKDLGIAPGASFDAVKTAASEEINRRELQRESTNQQKKTRSQSFAIPQVIGRARDSRDNRTEQKFYTALGAYQGSAPNNNRQVQQVKLLNYIIASPYATESEKELARQLLSVSDAGQYVQLDPNLNVPGQYDSKKDIVRINVTFMSDDYADSVSPFETVVLHELVHRFTVKSLNDPDNIALRDRANTLYTFVVDQARSKGVFDKYYGLNNVEEFISESFVSPEFQGFLKGLSYKSTKATAWEIFLDLVNDALKALGINTNQTALDEVIAISTNLITRGTRQPFSITVANLRSNLIRTITTSNTIDQNIDIASKALENIYDIEGLSAQEIQSLQNIINEHLNDINNKITNSDKNKITIGKFTFLPGHFLLLKDKKRIYTVEKQTAGKAVIISYVYKDKDGQLITSSTTINDPEVIESVFSNKKDAIDYLSGRRTSENTNTGNSTVESTSNNDDFGKALDDFIKYNQTNFQYGGLDPKLIELGSALIRESLKIGKDNFRSISSEIVSRVGEDSYKNIFNNLRAVYVATFATTKGLTDTKGEIGALASGDVTATMLLDELKVKPPVDQSDYLETSDNDQNIAMTAKNIQDKQTGELFKSTGQQYKTDSNGVWTNEVDNDPVKTRYYKFIDYILSQGESTGKSMSELGFYGLVIKDNLTLPNGEEIQHEKSALDYFEKGGKFGQIVIVVDKNNTPIRFNQNGEIDNKGQFIHFNLENVERVSKKNPEIVAKVNGMSIDEAKIAIQTASKAVEAIRNSAKDGKPVRIELSAKRGVPVFTEQLNSMTPIASQNIEIEIASVRKDDTNIAYFVNHPNDTGLIGGAYAFINGVPVKIEPRPINEKTADLIVAALDELSIADVDESRKSKIKSFLNSLIYQRYASDKADQKGTFYLKGNTVYINGEKVSKENRKSVLLENARYNIDSKHLNNNWSPFTIKDGKLVTTKPSSYNSFVMQVSQTKAAIGIDGKQVLANSYFSFNIDSPIENWIPNKTITEITPTPKQNNNTAKTVSKFWSTNYQAKDKRFGDKLVPLDAVVREVDFEETGIADLEDFFASAQQIRLVSLKVNEDGTREAAFYLHIGDSLLDPNGKVIATLKRLPSNLNPAPLEEVKVDTSKIIVEDSPNKESKTELQRKKDLLKEKLRQQNEALKSDTDKIGDDIDNTMTSLGRSISLERDTTQTVNQKELDWFAKTFVKAYSGENANREFRITSSLVNSNLWGQFTENGTRLYKDAEQGTLYHEAFHEFTQMYLTLDEKKSLYNNARKSIAPLKGKADIEVEEYLAEQFRKFVLSNGKMKISTPINNVFQRIWNYIKALFTGETSLETVFDNLYKGKINNYTPNINNIQFKRLNAGIQNNLGDSLFDATQSITVVKSIDRLIYDFIGSRDKSIVDVMSEPRILEASYKFSYKVFADKLIGLRNDAISELDKAETEQDFDRISNELEKQSEKFKRLVSNWNDVIKYHQEHSKTFIIKGNTIQFTYDDNGDIIEDNDDRKDQTAKTSYDATSGNEISSIDGANKETKALVRGLGKSFIKNGETLPKTNEFGIQELVDFGSTWNNLAINLQGTMEFDQMISKLENLSNSFPEYRELLDKLGYGKQKDSLKINQVSQLAKFRQDFSKPYVGIYETVFDPETNSYRVIEATKNNLGSIEDEFLDNFVVSGTSIYISKDTFGDNILTNEIKNLPINTLSDRIKFLDTIGIRLSSGTLNDPLLKDVLSGKALSAMKNSLVTLVNAGVPVNNPIAQLRAPNKALKLPGESGNIDEIIKLEAKYSRNNASASMINAEGSIVYALSLNNLLTISTNYLNNFTNYPKYQDVVSLPHMRHLDVTNNPYVKNSLWLNQMFVLDVEETDNSFGNRRLINGEPVTLNIINYNGLKVRSDLGASEGSTTTGLWVGDKLVQDFNSLLTSGVKEMMRAGDKASAFAVTMQGYSQETGRPDKLPVKLDDFSTGYGGIRTETILTGYLADELTRMKNSRFKNIGSNLDYYKGKSGDFNLFSGILSDKTKEELLKNFNEDTDVNTVISMNIRLLRGDFRNFFSLQVSDKIKSFKNSQFTLEDTKWIDSTLTSKYNVNQLLRAYTVNAFILNVEQTKVFNGDGAFYKAFHKRNSKDTSTGTTMMTDKWFLDWLNNDSNTNLQSKLLGVNNEVTNITNSVVFKDNEVASQYIEIYRKQLTALGLPKDKVEDIVSKYENANEGDAQGWITLDFYRTFKLAQGKWFPQHETMYQRVSKGETLTPEEVRDLSSYFMPIKAQYAGPLQYSGVYAPAFHKFSLVPLLPSIIKGTKMESLNEKMIRNNVGYGLFESGSKVATILDENGKKDNFYSDYKDRTALDPNTAFSALNPVFNHYLKEQVNIDPSLHDEVIFGTQFRKLLFQNIFNRGKAINEKWQKLYDEYSDTLDKLVLNEKQALLEELGMKEENGQYVNIDFTKLVDKFLESAKSRDMNDNVQSFMEYDKDSKSFKYPLDASVNRQQIQNMIMSIINNRLVRQHMAGDLMVQVASSGFEKYQKPTDVQIDQYGTNGLRFYHLKDGKTQSMQVKVPLNGDFSNLLYFNHFDGNKIETIERLNEALKNSQWMAENKKSVTMIGYRIPTQGLNSIEFMEIAEFLPPEAGNILILPTEIVVKAGSDFDIDKLSIFKPSIRTKTRFDKESGKRVVESASYVEPKTNDLSKSIKEQKQELKDKYEEESAKLRFRKDSLNEEGEAVMAARDILKEEMTQPLENITRNIYQVREIGLEITFLESDLDISNAERRLNGESPENTAKIDYLQSQLNTLYNRREELYEEQRIANEAVSELQDEYNQIRAALQTYYDKKAELYKSFGEASSEYYNKLEELLSFKSGLQNKIIEIGTQVLEDQNNFIQLITPNDTGLIKPMITKEGGIKNKNGYPSKTDYTGTAIYTEKTQEEKFLAGLVGKKALGIAAVNNTFTQLFETIGLSVNGHIKNKFGTSNPVYIRLLNNKHQDSYDFSDVYDESGLLKSEFISQMVNAYVDVLNDDFIFYANAGLEVAPTIFYLKNAGVSTEKIMYFINHPVIKYYINNIQATNSHIHKAISPESYNPAIRASNGIPSYKVELFKSLIGLPDAKASDVSAAVAAAAEKNPKVFTEQFLLGRIDKDISQINFEERRAILGHFLELQRQADMLRKYQASNSYDTSTAANPIESENFNMIANEVKQSDFIPKNYIKAIGNTVIKPYNVTKIVSDMFDNLMPATLNNQIVKFMLRNYKDYTDKDRIFRLFSNDLLLYVLSNYVTLDGLKDKPSAFEYVNGTPEGQTENVRYSMFKPTGNVDGRLSTRIKNFKNNPRFNELKEQFPIINQLRVETIKNTGGFTNITIYRGENTTDTQNSLIEQFTYLGNFSDPNYSKEEQIQVRKLFKDLALFGFFQSGLNKSPISFTDIIPNEFYTPMIIRGLEQFSRELFDEEGVNTDLLYKFSNLFKVNNPELFGEEVTIASYRRKNYLDSSKKTIVKPTGKKAVDVVNPQPVTVAKSVEKAEDNINAKDYTIGEFLEKNVYYYHDYDKFTPEQKLAFDNEEDIEINVYTRVTASNFDRALELENKYGEMFLEKRGKNFYIAGNILDYYNEVKEEVARERILEGIPSDYSEKLEEILTLNSKGFYDISSAVKYYQNERYKNEEEKKILEDFFKKQGVYNSILYNPDQLTLFPIEDLESSDKSGIFNYGYSVNPELDETLKRLEEQSKPCKQ